MSTSDHSFRIVREKSVANPVEYEKTIYEKGLDYERPPFTFHSTEWEKQASEVMSATSKGYVVGNAGTGETAKKNVDAFKKWSIVPKRLVKTEGLPDLSTEVFGHRFQFPIAAAPVGVQREYSSNIHVSEKLPNILQASSTLMVKWLPLGRLQRMASRIL